MTRDLTAVLDVFSVLGERVTDFDLQKFRVYLLPGWHSPSFSPLVLLPGESLELGDLRRIEELVRKHAIQNPTLSPAPYFNFFAGEGLYDMEQIRAVCAEAGWVIDKDPLSIEVLGERLPVRVRPSLYVTLVDSGRSGLHREYQDIIRRNFNADDNYLRAVEGVYRDAKAESYTVLIGMIGTPAIAGGTVSIRKKLSFLTWGCVNTEYRNKGIHRLLISACSTVAMSHGVSTCAFATRNKLIRRKWDRYVEMFICRKIC
jgi:hypothetical protein